MSDSEESTGGGSGSGGGGGSSTKPMLENDRFRRSAKCGYFSKFLEEKVDLRLEAFPIEFKDSRAVSYKDLVESEFKIPFKFRSSDPVPVGLKLPPKPMSNPGDMYAYLRSIAKNIGEDYPVKIIEVYSQKTLDGYEFGDYVEYLEKRDSSNKTVNLISLEMSKTSLSGNIMGPEFVRKLDWIDHVWPISRRAVGDYPCVQRYCLTGMAGSYTDFHIDFGGTSVWYHVVYGGKRFYVIEPTLANLKKFENWKQSDDTFFGDMVTTKCYYVDIGPGETFMIPGGWIHAVYTPHDSVVFGGNFLHSFGIVQQLQINEIEKRNNTEDMYRFPSFKLLNWMLLCCIYTPISRYVTSGSIDGIELTFFPLHKFFKPNIFQDVAILVKVCEEWLLETIDREFEDTSRQLCRISPKSLLVEWWSLLQRAASSCKTEDSKILLHIYTEMKSRKSVDVLDPTFFPYSFPSKQTLTQQKADVRKDFKLKIQKSTSEAKHNDDDAENDEEDDESYDESDDVLEDEEDESKYWEENIINSKKRGRVISADEDDDDDDDVPVNKALKDEKVKSSSSAPLRKTKSKVTSLQKLLLKKSSSRR